MSSDRVCPCPRRSTRNPCTCRGHRMRACRRCPGGSTCTRSSARTSSAAPPTSRTACARATQRSDRRPARTLNCNAPGLCLRLCGEAHQQGRRRRLSCRHCSTAAGRAGCRRAGRERARTGLAAAACRALRCGQRAPGIRRRRRGCSSEMNEVRRSGAAGSACCTSWLRAPWGFAL